MNMLKINKYIVIIVCFLFDSTYPLHGGSLFGSTASSISTLSVDTAALNEGIPPLDIDDWDQASILDITPHTFPINSFGVVDQSKNNDIDIINDMCKFFNDNQKIHVSLMRVVFICNNGCRYVYPIPYVFCSGRHSKGIISNWRNLCSDNKYQRLNLALRETNDNEDIALPIYDLIKGIGDYGYTCDSIKTFPHYAHSERAAILCLLYDELHSLEDARKALETKIGPNSYNANIDRIIIQIKVIHYSGICSCCNKFLGTNDSHVDKIVHTNNFNQSRIDRNFEIRPTVKFQGLKGNCTMDVHKELHNKSGISNIQIRISHSVAQIDF